MNTKHEALGLYLKHEKKLSKPEDIEKLAKVIQQGDQLLQESMTLCLGRIKEDLSTALELVIERLQRELFTSKGQGQIIEKLKDKTMRLETTTKCEGDDGIEYGGQIKLETVHAENIIKKDEVWELFKKVSELEKENEFLRQELKRMKKETRPKKIGEIYMEYRRVFRPSVCS